MSRRHIAETEKKNIYILRMIQLLELFSIECRDSKTNVITLTNHNSRKNPMNQSELETNTCSGRQARENAAGKSRLVLVLLLIGRESGARFFSQSQTVAMQNQSSWVITFNTQLKTALTDVKVLSCLSKSDYIEITGHKC